MSANYGNSSGVSARGYTRTPDGEVVAARYTTSRYYFSQDHLGSTTAIFNQDGTFVGRYSYSPYGEARGTTNTTVTNDNAIRYIGGYLDTDAGLYRLGARYYDPSLGRFTQADPSGQEAHPYAYSQSNPINFSDPSGLSALSFFEIASLIIDVIALGADALNAETQRELGLAIAAFGVGYIVGGVCTGLLVGSIATGPGVALALAGCGIISEAVSYLVQQA